MSTRVLPYAIQCAELAARRQSAATHMRMKGRMTDLASIAATAFFIGCFGTVLGILNSFRSFGSSQSAILADETARISEAMIPGALGLLVALLAYWSFLHLGDQLQAFELEMENATADLVNRLLLHLGRLRSSDPVLWALLSRKPASSGAVVRNANDVEPPRFRIDRIYPNGLRQMIWPHLQGETDKEVLSEASAWFCFVYAVIGALAYCAQHRALSGLIIFSFFVLAGSTIRRRERQGTVYSLAFLLTATLFNFSAPYGSGVCAILYATATLPLLGTLRANRVALFEMQSSIRTLARAYLLALLFAGACVTLTFGIFLGFYKIQSVDSSMSPTIRPGDWLVGTPLSASEAIHHADLLKVSGGVLRVVGLPGDRIQIKAGQLIRNGLLVQESYTLPSSEPSGDFPLPSTAYPEGYLRWSHNFAYPKGLTVGKAYLVPGDEYFMLNDNRNQLTDSRTTGPLRRANVMAKITLAVSPFSLRSPRLLR